MRNVLNINQDWFFIKDSAQVPAVFEDADDKINLPHTWNGYDGQDGGNDYFRGTCCYYKKILKSELPEGEIFYLEITGANASADVYMNGKHLAHHDGGYSTWRVNITENLEDENCIAILVENSINEVVYPQTADFTFYGGLYRDVNVIAVPATHFDLDYFGGNGLVITPVMEGADAKVTVETYVTNLAEGDRICYVLTGGEGNVICEENSESLKTEFIIQNAHLWNGIKDPYLYRAEVSLVREGKVIDSVTSRFGCRNFEIDPEKGFILNGKEYPLRGVSRHQDRWEIGNALLPEHHIEDMDLICEMGANTIRLAHYQHDQFFYDLCDERGMVIWAEIPYISRHMPDANENTVSQMKELIVQNYNHPSIVVWGISNEITMDGAKDPDMLALHHRLNDMVHEMDKTRLTTIACISMCDMDEKIVHITDVVAYNHYFGWYGGSTDDNAVWFDKFHAKYPGRAIGCSEYGCEALNWHNSNPKQGDYSEEYQAYYHEELIKQFFTRPYLWATHVWNMFDFGADARAEGGENGQNHKGLITIDRKYKKDAFYAYKAWLSDEPFVHLCGKRYIDRVEDVTKVTVYSNLPEVEIFANGESLGKKTSEEHFFYFEVPNSGETTLKAVAGDCTDESVIRKVETVNQDYILREQGAVLNWFDITEKEGYYSLNDTLGDIMKSFRGKFWFVKLFMALAKKQSGPKQKGDKKKKKKGKNPDLNSGVMNMISGFTVLRFTGMLGMRNISFTKEELLKMNSQLNKIRKPAKLRKEN